MPRPATRPRPTLLRSTRRPSRRPRWTRSHARLLPAPQERPAGRNPRLRARAVRRRARASPAGRAGPEPRWATRCPGSSGSGNVPRATPRPRSTWARRKHPWSGSHRDSRRSSRRWAGDRGYSTLDLADHAGNSHLEVLGQFSRQIRFAGLTPSPPHGEAFASALTELPPGPCAYDVVLAWDVMDRLGPHERERLMDCLVEVTAPRAWLHAVVDSSGDESAPPLRLTLINLDRVSQQAVGPPEPLAPQLLPMHVERLFRPFEIVHAYTLRARWREYVARRR